MHAVDPGPPIATINPATGELLERFEPLDAAALETRLAIAAAGARTWAASSFEDRSRLLVTAAELPVGAGPCAPHLYRTTPHPENSRTRYTGSPPPPLLAPPSSA